MILVDTDVLIAHLRGIETARDWLRDARTRGGPLSTSVLCVAEIIGGVRSGERRQVATLLGSLRPLPVSDMIAHRAGQLRREYRRSHGAIGIVDYLIAATAQQHGLEPATLNTRHYPMFEGLRPPFRV